MLVKINPFKGGGMYIALGFDYCHNVKWEKVYFDSWGTEDNLGFRVGMEVK